jgi:hypothetical protein
LVDFVVNLFQDETNCCRKLIRLPAMTPNPMLPAAFCLPREKAGNRKIAIKTFTKPVNEAVYL